MENGANKCSTCRHFNRYYVKGIKKYNAVEYGWCCKKVCVLSTNDTCDEYTIKTKIRRFQRPTRIMLSEMLTEISSIRSILEEEKNENA